MLLKKLRNMDTKRLILLAFILIFAIIFLVSAYFILRYYNDSNKAKKEFEKLSDLVVNNEEESISAGEKYIHLYEKNEDFIGWIAIDGTNISYPVVQSKNLKDYYLRRGFDKEYSYHGVPYVDEDCDIDISDNTIIYGHNMLDDTMFSALEKYKDSSFYANHKYIRFDTINGYGLYEIIAVIKSSRKLEEEFKYYDFINAWNEEHFDEYIAGCKANSLYQTDAGASFGDKLITLSTCEYTTEDGRLAVIAKKIA